MPPKEAGRTILIATLTAAPGKVVEVQHLLAAIRKLAESKDEPLTHTYRTQRSQTEPNKFVVYEEYDGIPGIQAHTAAAPFQALAASGIFSDLTINYYQEFDGEGADKA